MLLVTAWLDPPPDPLLPRLNGFEWMALVRSVLPFSSSPRSGHITSRIRCRRDADHEHRSDTTSASHSRLEALIVIPSLMITGVFPDLARGRR